MSILFGVRSPLVIDYQISALRCDRPFSIGISIDGAPRAMPGLEIVDLDRIDGVERRPVIPCAFGPARREELFVLAEERGFPLADSLVDPTAILPPGFRQGGGGFVNAGAIIGGGCMFGDGVLINRSASIGHHCLLGDWVSVGPGAVLSGNIRVGRNSMIGAGAVLQSDIRIGTNVRIAAGTVVRKPVPDNSIVSGNPGRIVPARAVPSTLKREGAE